MYPICLKHNLIIPDRTLEGVKFEDVPKSRRVDENGFCICPSYPIIDFWDHPVTLHQLEPYHKLKIRCPVCGRRLTAKVFFNDGDKLFTVSRHKPKGYKIKQKKHRKPKYYRRSRWR